MKNEKYNENVMKNIRSKRVKTTVEHKQCQIKSSSVLILKN